MKTINVLIILFISIVNFTNGQSSNCNEKFLNCKETVINGFRNNNDFADNLSNQLVQMVMCDSSLGSKFTDWYDNFVANYKTNLDKEFNQLQNEKKNIAKESEKVRLRTLDNSTKMSQKIIEESYQTKTNNKKTTPYKCEDCPAGTQR